MAYRHVRRVKRIYLDGVDRAQVPRKSNSLLVGPTGCGKTYLIELLFGKILKLPTALVDVTTYSETGYVGQDPCTILTRVLHAADDNPMLASIGIVCLDEFDKIASGQNNAIFAGPGTTKDGTGMGVQRE
jgi:ATP-dependent Clp protease ATP-binding subunit ClpX